jgi:hypothetical protein
LLTAAGKIAGSTADPTGFVSPTNGAKFGFVANNVTGFIQALETIGSTKILASPRILVLNKQRAEIQLGSRLGFQTFSQNFTSTIQQVQFLNVGTLLRIRPFISEDGMIRMEIHPERSSGTVTDNIPNQQTAELTTNVMVPDGATLVIGGLMEDEDDFQLQGLPGLSRIPGLGYLFGFRQKDEKRRELVVLLTPHIWTAEQVMAHGPIPNIGAQISDRDAPADSASTRDGATDRTAGDATLVDPAVNASSASTNRPGTSIAAAAALPVAASASAEKPRRGFFSTGKNQKQQTPDPQTPRRGYIRSFVDRISHRSDTPKAQAAQPNSARVDPNSACDPPTSPRLSNAARSTPSAAPNGAAGARDPGVSVGGATVDFARSPASVQSAMARPERRDAMLRQASWEASPDTARDYRELRMPEAARTIHDDTPRSATVSHQDDGTSKTTDVASLNTAVELVLPKASTATSQSAARQASVRGAASMSASVPDSAVVQSHSSARDSDLSDARESGSSTRWRPAQPGPSTRASSPPANSTTRTAQDRPLGFDAADGDERIPREPFSPAEQSRGSTAPKDQRRAMSEPPTAPPRRRASPTRSDLPIHVVRPFETLRSIARDRLDDSRRASEIAELNRDRLGESGALAPGQVLLLPADARPTY